MMHWIVNHLGRRLKALVPYDSVISISGQLATDGGYLPNQELWQHLLGDCEMGHPLPHHP